MTDRAGAGDVPAPVVVLDLSEAEIMCGDPAIGRVRRAWAALEPGAVLEVRSPIAEHRFQVRAVLQHEGGVIVADTRDGDMYVVRVTRPR